MDIYEKAKKEVEEKNKLKVGDVCAYVGDVPWFAYSNCVIHEVRDDGNYMVKFSDGGLEIVAPNELVKMPGVEWKEPNIASSLPYIPYDYKYTKNLLDGLHSSGTITMDNNTGGIKFVKEEGKEMELKLGDRVRCTGGSLSSYGKLGSVVSINEYYDSEASDIGVKFDDSDWVTHFPGWTKSLELIEDNTKFKKGDRVVCVKQPTDTVVEMKGLKGTVLGSDSDGWTMVEFDKNIAGHDGGHFGFGKLGHCWGMKKEHLRLLSEEENKMDFKYGDTVELLDGTKKGQKFKVTGTKCRVGAPDETEIVCEGSDGKEYQFHYKRLKLISMKDEKGEKKMMFNFKVVGAYPNKKKGILAVKFNDGEVIKLACHDDDNFDINVGVALAMAYKSCGGKNAFRRNVQKVTQEVKSKEDKVKNEEDKVFGDYDAKSFGRIIKAKRIKMKMPQNLLAQIVGANQSNISEYESGKYLPRKELRQKIINALGL